MNFDIHDIELYYIVGNTKLIPINIPFWILSSIYHLLVIVECFISKVVTLEIIIKYSGEYFYILHDRVFEKNNTYTINTLNTINTCDLKRSLKLLVRTL